MTDGLFTHALMTLLQDLVTVTVNNGFLHIPNVRSGAS
jgi:hypothetical protein